MTMRMSGVRGGVGVALACGLMMFGVPVTAQDSAALGAAGCGTLDNHFGPFDYRVDKKPLEGVEHAHFTPNIENLIRGNSGPLGGELDYTLRAFPNHHRALMAMLRLGFRDKTDRPRGARYKVECWMIRAEVFRHDDPMVKMIYGVYLLRSGRSQEAVEKLEAATELGEENANLHYNLGLAYVRLKRYEDALKHAHKAYGLGFPLPGLREQLQRAGHWQAPGPDTPQKRSETAPSAANGNPAPVAD